MNVSSQPETTDEASIAARVAVAVRQFPGIAAAYLFGSHATGRADADSDIDIALVVDHPLGCDKLDLYQALVEAGLDRVDLVELGDEDLVMRHEAVHPNRLLYARPDFDHGAYFSRTVREYSDFKPYLDRLRRAYRQRLTHGST